MHITDAGRVVIAGFDGTIAGEHVKEALKLGVGGFILFRRNIETPEQTVELIADIRSLAGKRRLLFAVDQEGGRVARFDEPWTIWPPMRALGKIGDATLARQFGQAVARELRAVGFDIDFAPVADVDSNPQNPVIGDRSFGADPKIVGRMVKAVIDGLQSEGVWACAKHFPGHGDTETDSHLELPVIRHKIKRLEQVEFPPFQAAIEAGVACIMTAHILVEAIDEKNPATLSMPALSMLRERFGFQGLIISDDLEMKAIAERYPLDQAAVRAAEAGADLLLVCHDLEMQERVIRGLYDARATGKLSALRLDEMHKRLERTMSRFSPPEKADLKVIGCEEHKRLARRIEDCRLTIVD